MFSYIIPRSGFNHGGVDIFKFQFIHSSVKCNRGQCAQKMSLLCIEDDSLIIPAIN